MEAHLLREFIEHSGISLLIVFFHRPKGFHGFSQGTVVGWADRSVACREGTELATVELWIVLKAPSWSSLLRSGENYWSGREFQNDAAFSQIEDVLADEGTLRDIGEVDESSAFGENTGKEDDVFDEGAFLLHQLPSHLFRLLGHLVLVVSPVSGVIIVRLLSECHGDDVQRTRFPVVNMRVQLATGLGAPDEV